MSERTHELLRRGVDHAFAAARFAIDGLSDDEFQWAPVPGAWTVRDGVLEHDPDVPPQVTSIGWRAAHLAMVLAVYESWAFGDGAARWETARVPGDAGAAVAAIVAGQASFRRWLDDDTLDLDAMRPTAWGQDLPVWQLVWTVLVESLHHGAEIGALRDAKRGLARSEWWPEMQDGRPL